MKETTGRVMRIRQETHDVKAYKILLNDDFDYSCGQYVLISIEDNEEFADANKPFTISSSPTCNRCIELTIKKVGEFTTFMHNIEPGTNLRVNGPLGDSLIFDENIDRDVVFISAGSGITPFISSLRYKVANGLENNVVLFNGNRTREDIIFRDELEELSVRDDIRVINTLTREPEDSDWDGERGHVDIEMVKKYVDDICSKIFYLCGPPKMIEEFEEGLGEMGLPEEQIKREYWRISSKGDRE